MESPSLESNLRMQVEYTVKADIAFNPSTPILQNESSLPGGLEEVQGWFHHIIPV